MVGCADQWHMCEDDGRVGSAPDYGTAHFDSFAPFVDAMWRAADLDDVGFYVEAARAVDGPALELGCGTGRVYLPTLAAGVDVDGVDLSGEMLSVLRERAAAEGLEPSVRRADVTDFAVDREYDLVTFPFRGFLHLTDRTDQVAALRRVRETLATGGRFVLDFFAPSFDVVCEMYGTAEATEFSHEGERYRIETTSTVENAVEMVTRVERRLLDAEGAVLRERSFPLKLLPKREFEGLIDLAGFSGWRVFEGFEATDVTASVDAESRTLGPDPSELVWVVER